MKSRVEALILNILGEQEELSPPLSRIEEILYSILNDTAYIKDPLSRIEAIVLAIKEKDEYTRNALSRIEEILKAILDGTNDYDKLPQSDIERDLIRFLGEWVTKTGDIVTFATDQVVPPFKRCEVELEPIQDLHGYDNPWPAGGGKNKFDISKMAERAGVTVSGNTFTGLARSFTSNGLVTDFSATSGTTLNVSCSAKSDGVVTSGAGFALLFVYSDNTTVRPWYTNNSETSFTNHSGAITAEKDIIGYRFGDYNNGTENTWTVNNFQIEIGSTATSYAPYSNLCPISGRSDVSVTRTGKNLIKVKYAGRTNNGVTYSTNEDGTITMTGTASGSSYFAQNYGFNTKYMTLLKAGTYTLSSDKSSANVRVYGSKWSLSGESLGSVVQDQGSGTSFTLTEPTWFSFQIYVVSGTATNFTLKPQIEVGSAKSAYSPYVSDTVTLQLGQTVYGGTVDVTRGKLVIDKVAIDTTTIGYWQKSGSFPGGYFVQACTLGLKTNTPFICSHAKTATRLYDYLPGTCYCDSSINIRIMPGNSTLEDWESYRASQSALGTPVTVCGELATPVEVTLTPEEIHALLGNNCVWSDAGKITVTYHS